MRWKEQLAAYEPQTETEKQAKEEILSAAETYGMSIFRRDCPAGGHITCSGMILDETMQHVLMVHHNIYRSFSWTGGHADGDTNFLAVAVREAKEETGITVAQPLCSSILSLDVLPVAAHKKNGQAVAAHVHYNVSYGLIALKKEKLKPKPDENSAVQWIPIEKMQTICREKNMLPIYEKLIDRMRAVRQQQQVLLQKIVQPLCQWYPAHARNLPWRRSCDPYHIWVSEIMLQQTRAETVKDYYTRFLTRFPTIQDLAQADEASVHKIWEGLGYYTRVRNLHAAAKGICHMYDGRFPTRFEEIRRLPGVGDYTAGAICSICYGQPVAAVDGNVLRVVMRLQDSFAEIDRLSVKQRVIRELSAVYPKDNGTLCGMLTQALMELGATVCIPGKNPNCTVCPLASLCLSRARQTFDQLPVRKPKAPKKIVPMTVFILCCDDQYAVCQRPMYGLLAGLWEFPNIEQSMDEQQIIHQVRTWGCKPLSITRTAEHTHVFTHLQWQMVGVYVSCGIQSSIFQWKTMEEITKELTIPAAFQKFFL
ncbi:MAG: A/G-specific adenine glycosylase [Ruminococcus sp.]